jgi:hypothetical protein
MDMRFDFNEGEISLGFCEYKSFKKILYWNKMENGSKNEPIGKERHENETLLFN